MLKLILIILLFAFSCKKKDTQPPVERHPIKRPAQMNLQEGWFEVPYIFDGLLRRCAIDTILELRDKVDSSGSIVRFWSESEIGGNDDDRYPFGRAIVKVIADSNLVNRVANSFVELHRDSVVARCEPKRSFSINSDGVPSWGEETWTKPITLLDREVRFPLQQAGLFTFFQIVPNRFPSVQMLDTFNRTNEDPLAGGWNQWTTTAALGELQVLSNQAAGNGAGSGPNDISVYTSTTFTDTEVAVQVPTRPATGNLVSVYLRQVNTGGVFNVIDGYASTYTNVSGASNDTFVLVRIDNGTGTQLGATITQEEVNGFWFGGRIEGSNFNIYHKTSSLVTFALLGSRSDATYSAAGQIGIGVDGSTARVDNCVAGEMKTYRRIL